MTKSKKQKLDELAKICEREFKRTSLSWWTIFRLRNGIRSALAKVPEDMLPHVKDWGKYFYADALWTEHFLVLNNGKQRDDHTFDSAISDVLSHWKIQASAVCNDPSLLELTYRERAEKAELPAVASSQFVGVPNIFRNVPHVPG